MDPAGHTICLSMIVKNEAPVIRRCLDSVRPIIDHWVIVDTGSTDGTQDIIREALKDLPGELHQRPWRDFAHNRSEALALARAHGDYSLIIDADDALELPTGFQLAELTADSYVLEIRDSSVRHERTQLVRNSLPWRYAGVLHEFLTCEGAGAAGRLPIWMRRNHDGARRRDPETYRKDVAILENALLNESDPFMIARYTFYLAQSYRDSRQQEKALEKYLARAELGFWQEEVFVSLLQAARLKEQLRRPDPEVIDAYLRAADACPTRAEALHGASRFCRHKGRNEDGYRIAKRGLNIAIPSGALFVEPWIYDYGLRDEFAVNAYWTGRYRECLGVCLQVLALPTLRQADWGRVVGNAGLAFHKLPPEPASGLVDLMVWPTGSISPSTPLAMPAVATSRSVSGMVSIITPTRNRDRFLSRALTYFRTQDYNNIEWLILDDSVDRSVLFSGIEDDRIFYRHIERPLSIGEKRNALIERAKGEIIIHFDDDDYYAPHYVRTMVSALADRRADLINLRGWFLYDWRTHFFGYWDLMRKDGPHYRCDSTGVALTMPDPRMSRALENNQFGFGFTYAFKKTVWDAVKFPAIDWREDGEFSGKARSIFKVDGFHDTTGLCVHFLHQNSTSRCYPQHHLPRFLFQRLFPALDCPAPPR